MEVMRVLVVQEPCAGYRDALEELLSSLPEPEQARRGRSLLLRLLLLHPLLFLLIAAYRWCLSDENVG